LFTLGGSRCKLYAAALRMDDLYVFFFLLEALKILGFQTF
jgi:hypothetical protein